MIQFEEIPIEFVIRNSTEFQKTSMRIKWEIYHFVNSYDGTKQDAYIILSESLNLSDGTIRNIYDSCRKMMEIV